MGDHLTINAGLRFDHSRAISQDVSAIDMNGRKTAGIMRGFGTLYTWNVLSPRLGVVAKLGADGRTMLRASYGRFYQGVLTGEISPIHPGAAPVTTMAFDAATGGYTTLVSVVDPKINLRIDPETKAPRTDEYVLPGRGGHWRADFPHPSPAWARRLVQRVDDTGTRVICRAVPLPNASQPIASGA